MREMINRKMYNCILDTESFNSDLEANIYINLRDDKLQLETVETRNGWKIYKMDELVKKRVVKRPLILELYETFDQMCQVRGFKNMLNNPKTVSNVIKEHSCCFSLGDFLIYRVYANYVTGIKSTEPVDGAFDYIVNNEDYDPHCIIDNHVICLNKKQDVIHIITDRKDNYLGKYFFNEEEAKNYVKSLM